MILMYNKLCTIHCIVLKDFEYLLTANIQSGAAAESVSQ